MSDNAYLQFASNLRSLREKKGITKWRLSKLCGVAYYTYRHWENGVRLPGIIYGYRLALALGCDVGALLAGIDLDDWSFGRKGAVVSHDERLVTSVVTGPLGILDRGGSKKTAEPL